MEMPMAHVKSKLTRVLIIMIAAPVLVLQAQWLNHPNAGIPRLPNGQPQYGRAIAQNR